MELTSESHFYWLIPLCFLSIPVVYGGNLYIFGGYNGLHEVHFGDMFKLDVGK